MIRIRTIGRRILAAAGVAAMCGAAPASAEIVLSFYTGINDSPSSTVNFDFLDGAGPQSTRANWDGESNKMPPYFGWRVTWWMDNHPNWGLAFDNAHTKVAAKPMPAQFSLLEFTDGINMVTFNVHYRFLNKSRFTPYVGAGLGFTTPHVEVANVPLTTRTSEYQFGGPAAQVLVGVEAEINDRWAVFAELKSGWADIEADLSGGGWLNTEVISNQIALGVSYKFKKR